MEWLTIGIGRERRWERFIGSLIIVECQKQFASNCWNTAFDELPREPLAQQGSNSPTNTPMQIKSMELRQHLR